MRPVLRILAALATRRGVFNALTAAFLIALLWGLCKTPAWDGGLISGAIVAAALAAFVGNFEHFESFKASPMSGIEARTRAVAERAENALNELHTLAELTGSLLVALIAGEGRWGGMDRSAKIEKKSQVFATLKSLGLSDDALARIEAADRDYDLYDYAYNVIRQFRQTYKEQSQTKLNEFISKSFRELKRPPDPDEIQSFLASLGPLDNDVLECMADYRHYLAFGKHRRPEQWRLVGPP